MRARNCKIYSETFMKTFEEKWTAWLDDQLSGRELSEFEASLPDMAAAQAEKTEAKKLGKLLKRELSAHPLNNEDFFSHQLREKIVQESGEQDRRPTPRSARESWWTKEVLVDRKRTRLNSS